MSKKFFIIDRIENHLAICEDFFTGNQKEIPVKEITSGFKEGDVIFKEGLTYKIDIEKTIQRKIDIKLKFDSIW